MVRAVLSERKAAGSNSIHDDQRLFTPLTCDVKRQYLRVWPPTLKKTFYFCVPLTDFYFVSSYL